MARKAFSALTLAMMSSTVVSQQVRDGDPVLEISVVEERNISEYKKLYEGAYDYVDEESEWDKIVKAVKSSFALPFHELYEKKYDSEWKNLFAGFSGGLSLGYPLTRSVVEGVGGEGDQAANNVTLGASLKYKLLGNWFISGALIDYANEDLKRPWSPEFVYVFGYSDWRPYTVSLTYSNYGGNRLNPDRSAGERHTDFSQGAWALGWKFPMPQSWQNVFKIFDDKGSIGCNVGLSLVRKFSDPVTSETKSWKRTLSAGCKYTIIGSWYVNVTGFFYPVPSQKQPWNPDFTYGFGYFDWHPGTITVQYNNYSGNRWPWNEPSKGTGQFKNGGLSIAWSWSY